MVVGEGEELEDLIRDWVETEVGPVVALARHKQRPWATVWRVRTTEQVFFAKQNCPGQAFEAALVPELAGLAPSHVVPVAAADPGRGLLLTPDQGAVFGATVAPDDLDAWCRLVTRAMELGRLLTPHAAGLASHGLTPCRVPGRVASLVAPWSEEVATLGLPDTVCHNDLHEHNAFDRPGGLVLFDFADTVRAHPLCELLVPLTALADHLDASADDARLRRVADAGLEVWSDLAPTTQLRACLPAALRLARLCRAESWARVVPDFTGEALVELGSAADDWIDRLPDPVPVVYGAGPPQPGR